MNNQTAKIVAPFNPKLLDVRFSWWGGKRKRIQVPEGWVALPKADLYIDARVIPEKGINGVDGASPEFQAGVIARAPETIKRMVDTVIGGLALIGDRRREKDPYEDPVEVCFFCAYGIHRSKASALIVADRLRKLGYKIQTQKLESYITTLTHKIPLVHKF